MNYEETVILLNSYKLKKRKVKSLKIKVQEMERRLEESKGITYDKICVGGGKHLSREEQFAEMLDCKDRYVRDINALERGCERIMDMIKSIFTSYESKTLLNVNESIKREYAEIVLIDYYINGMSIIDLMNDLHYSRCYVYRLMKYGTQKITQNYKNEDYKKLIVDIYQM